MNQLSADNEAHYRQTSKEQRASHLPHFSGLTQVGRIALFTSTRAHRNCESATPMRVWNAQSGGSVFCLPVMPRRRLYFIFGPNGKHLAL